MPAQAGRGAALGTYAAQDARGPVGRERYGYPAGHEVPQKRVKAALSALVRSATRSISASRKSGAAPRMRPRDLPAPAVVARGGQKVVAGASSPLFLRALPAKLESTLPAILATPTDGCGLRSAWVRDTPADGERAAGAYADQATRTAWLSGPELRPAHAAFPGRGPPRLWCDIGRVLPAEIED
jgi:hypothetical protein